ncbi:FtsX-like permease family protein [Nocardioides hwasunensis]|uniref:ABC3 transporter permease C-terminal domain-containing protein n=1 Tax=Nocardioides hwasunensis TaxID=397258 RepID=A0ABR8MHU3_9ACTN|nr:FtsX-like permease family protein [Nocardioides hwasunensis]MBD3914821.1 hypothetical protein [Nocardioides hwasunensis]
MVVRRSPRASGQPPGRRGWWSALRHRRGQAAALLAVSALITACTAFAPVYERAMQQALAETLLSQASTAERVVALGSESAVNAIGVTEARDPRELQALLPADVAGRLGDVVLDRRALVSPTTGAVPPNGLLVWRDGACAHLQLLSGRCPDASGEIVVSEADADHFGLAVGSTLAVAPAEDGPDVPLEVVGTYDVVPDDGWWQGLGLVGASRVAPEGASDPSAAHDAWLTSEGTFAAAAVLPGESSQAGALVPSTTDVDGLLALDAAVRAMTTEVRGQGDDLRVVRTTDDLADDVGGQIRLGAGTVPLLLAPLTVLSVFVLWLVLGAAVQQRRGEVAVARLRGRGPGAAVRLLLAELLPALLAGVVPGVAAALAGGAVAGALLPGPVRLELAPGTVTAVLLAVLVLVLTTFAAAVRVAREPLDALVRSGRTGASRWRLGALDAVLLAVAGTGVLAFVTGSLTTRAALVGPALLALFVGLLVSRIGAPVASRVGRALLRRGRLVAGLTLLETGRRRETGVLVTVVTVAAALAMFSLSALAIGERTRDNASEHDAGAAVVLGIEGHDLDRVRTALRAADPAGGRATPVAVAKDTLAVDTDTFRRVAYFPRGGPTAAQWRSLAPPDHPPVVLSGTRVSLSVRAEEELVTQDLVGAASELRLGLVVTAATGVRSTVVLGPVPVAGEQATLRGRLPTCADGCALAAVQLRAAQGVVATGGLELGDLRVDGDPVDLGTSVDDWNATEDQRTVLRPLPGGADDVLHVLVSVRGFYPVELTPAWVPETLAVVVPTARTDAGDPVVTGVDGADRAAEVVARTTLLPALPDRSALVDLDAATRGRDITFDAHLEVWLDDDPTLVSATQDALRDQGIGITDVRRHSEIEQAYAHTVPTWSLALGAVVGPTVVLVAMLVLLVLAVIGWRDRSRELAILRLNGATRRTTARLAVWAHLPAVLVAVIAGAGAGLVGATLAMPDVAFFPVPAQTPVVDTSTAWPVVGVAVAACAVVLPATAALAGRAIARRAHLEQAGEAG